AYDITHRIGLPECRITLAQATTYLASAPKSNASYAAINAAMDDVKHDRTIPVPVQLMSASKTEKKRMGHGQGYQYAHAAEGGVSAEEYLGVDKTYYTPTDRGYEQRIDEYLQWARSMREINRPKRDGDGAAASSPQDGTA
ncbi:MAG: replication-associated recombination protein A, partial [Planctomycetota bacterium]